MSAGIHLVIGSQLKILDMYCGVGGASLGYAMAGHEVTGVDFFRQPNYPFKIIRRDAIAYVTQHGHEYDLIHASPPCQAYTALTGGRPNRDRYPDLIPGTRGILNLLQVPWIMENVPGAIMRRDLVLCGTYFGLQVIRHRYFEISGLQVTQPPHIPHPDDHIAVYGSGGGYKGSLDDWRNAMQLHHAKRRKELANAIPPAYTRYIADNWTIGISSPETSPVQPR